MKLLELKRLFSYLSLAGLILCAGCDTKSSTSGDAKIATGQNELAALETKRKARVEELKSMDLPRLAQELSADSKLGAEPFNSMAYREVVSRGDVAAAKLKETLSVPDGSSLLALVALHKLSPAQYKSVEESFRTKVLADALKNSKFFNTWGIPHLFWEDAAKMVIEEGPAMERPLVALLDDKREGRIWGSEGALEQQQYRYRVCDYAWALLNEVQAQRVAIPQDPAERDKLIEKTRNR